MEACGLLAVKLFQEGGAAEALKLVALVHRVAQQEDGVPFVLEPLRGDALGSLDDANDGDSGRRVDGAVGALLLERAVAAGDGGVAVPTGVAEASHRFLELIEQLGIVGSGAVLIVRRAQRFRRCSR